MSETDSFVEEVSEEIRRDRLYGFLRKYGWAIGAVLALIIGGAIFNEWRKARDEAARQAPGDALLDAIGQTEPEAQLAALEGLSGADGAHAALADLARAALLAEQDRTEDAIAAYNAIAERSDLSTAYTDLAAIKALMLDPDAPDADQAIDALASAGRPYRPLALELRAQKHIAAGDVDAALADLREILEGDFTTDNLRTRAQQLTVVLGGEIPQLPVLLPDGNDG